MRKKLLLIVILFMFASSAFAAIHVAVLETIASNSDLMTLSERQYLTNILREQAVKALPSDENYIIMTRENINMMLPPGKAIEDCEGSCMAETGRNIAADYVAQAHVGQFGSSLTINVELYETSSGKLMTSFNGRGENIEKLEQVINEKSGALFDMIKVSNQKAVVVPVDTVKDSAALDSSRYALSEKELANEMQEKFPVDTVEKVPTEPERKKYLWGGLFVGATYNDYYDTEFGFANLKSTDEYTVKVDGAKGLLGNFWGVGVNAGLGGLLLFNDYVGLRADAAFAYRQGSGKSDVTVRLYWTDESRESEKSDMEIEYSVTQMNIDIPLALRFMVPGAVYVELGPQVSFNLSSTSKSKVTDVYGSENYETKNDFKSFEFDALVGIGVMRYIGQSVLDFNLRFVLGLTPVAEASDAPKTWQGQFSIAYWFI